MTTGKTITLTKWTRVGKVMSLLFNVLSRLVTAFLPRSKCLLISWLQSPSAVILGPPQNKVCHCFHCFPSICHEVMGQDTTILVFWMLSFKPTFSFSTFTFIKRTLIVSYGNPLQCYCLENPRDRGAWWAAVLLCPWNFPGKNTRIGYHFLFQGIFPSQG